MLKVTFKIKGVTEVKINIYYLGEAGKQVLGLNLQT